VVTVEETGERTTRQVFDTKELQDMAANSRCRSPKKSMRAAEPNDDELADNDGLASLQSSADKQSTNENQSLKR
jgi:hypothetical protein